VGEGEAGSAGIAKQVSCGLSLPRLPRTGDPLLS